jgi:hypothetical protein
VFVLWTPPLEYPEISHALCRNLRRFCELKTGNCDGVARFIHLWKYSDGKWSLSRVISYDHHIGAP